MVDVGTVDDVEMKNAYLDQLWSKAVKVKWNHCCALCFKTDGIESHHIVHRRKSWPLRWDVENGIALCQLCHTLADTINYIDRIRPLVAWDYLGDMQTMYKLKYDFLLDKSIGEEEYRKMKAEELRNIIKSGDANVQN